MDIRIKSEYVSQVLRESAMAIREGQNQVAEEWNLFDTGRLKDWLQGHFSFQSQAGGGKLSMRYLKYARFLDMKDDRRSQKLAKREGYHLYNHLVFGIIYNKTLDEIRYGLTDDIKQSITAAIQKAVRNKASFQ